MRRLRPSVAGYLMAALVCLLLVLQVGCELAVPYITADLISTGIGRSGIRSVLSERFSREGMEQLLLLLTDEERQTVLSGYEQDGDFYVRAELDGQEQERLTAVITPPMVAVYALTTDGADYAEVLGDDLYVPRGIDAFGLLALMPQETRLAMTEAARERIASVPPELIEQAAVCFVRDDLERQGIDIEALQRTFVTGCISRLVLAAVALFLLSLAGAFLVARLSAGCADALRLWLFSHALRLPQYDASLPGAAQLARVTVRGTQQVQRFLDGLLGTALPACLLAAGVLAMMWRMERQMGLLAAVCLLVCAAVAGPMAWMLAARRRSERQAAGQYDRKFDEVRRGVSPIRAFGAQDREREALERYGGEQERAMRRAGHVSALLVPSVLLAVNMAAVAASYHAAPAINEGAIRTGNLVACFQYLVLLGGALVSLASFLPLWQETREAAGQIRKLLETEVPNSAFGHPVKDAVSFHDGTAAVVFEHVTFSYPGSARPALCDLSFQADYGEMTAVVGGTGAGKSTLLMLAAALSDAYEGRIRIDGTQVDRENSGRLRQKIGYVPQKFVLFAGTARENLRLGAADADEETLRDAVRAAQADDFLEEAGEGLETQISAGGGSLSGGQRQRLCIARALAGQKEIVLLDDAASALDERTAASLRASLSSRLAGTAALVVTGRIGVAKKAGRILVLDDGRLAGSGTHDELMWTCRVYRELAASQGFAP